MLQIMKTSKKKRTIALPVVLGAVIGQGQLLLIKRNFLPFVGLWGMPGGKVHFGEHLDQAVIREVWEECNIKTKWLKLCGVVTENLYLNRNNSLHYLLHIGQLRPINFDLKPSNEGKVRWFPLKDLSKLRKEMIPSDFIMLNRLVLGNPRKFYYRCDVKRSNDQYIVNFFR